MAETSLESFLLLLNALNYILDHFVYCGLLGQVLVGMVFGMPLGQWISLHGQEFIIQLGYLGLILLVYEGGLMTSFSTLKANAPLSFYIALTGVVVPICASFSLQGLVDATPLQAFAAGAALCSTSLGTTLTVMSTSKLSNTRLGVILSGSAMMDDVVGLVMVQVVSQLGGTGDAGFSPVAIIRPVAVSIGFAIVIPLICRFIATPLTKCLNSIREEKKDGLLQKFFNRTSTIFIMHTAILTAAVATAAFVGTSNLFAAYLSGVAISWWDSEILHIATVPIENSGDSGSSGSKNGRQQQPTASNKTRTNEGITTSHYEAQDQGGETFEKKSGLGIYRTHYQQPVNTILKPLFFASIGFSIPITHMFNGIVVWRGIVYAILMTSAKLVCGLWLIRLSSSPLSQITNGFRNMSRLLPFSRHSRTKDGVLEKPENTSGQRLKPLAHHCGVGSIEPPLPAPTDRAQPLRSFSIYPAAILGTAMVARGEIGFLVSSVAASNGIFNTPDKPSETSDIFLVVIWAIVLCTIIGPFGVGLLIRRERRLEESSRTNCSIYHNSQDRVNNGIGGGEELGSGRDALGAWGVDGNLRK